MDYTLGEFAQDNTQLCEQDRSMSLSNPRQQIILYPTAVPRRPFSTSFFLSYSASSISETHLSSPRLWWDWNRVFLMVLICTGLVPNKATCALYSILDLHHHPPGTQHLPVHPHQVQTNTRLSIFPVPCLPHTVPTQSLSPLNEPHPTSHQTLTPPQSQSSTHA